MNRLKFIVKLVIYIFAVLAATTIIHEIAHFIVAFITGVPFSEIHVRFLGINPGLFIENTARSGNLELIWYSGGFIEALFALAFYLGHSYRTFISRPNRDNWCKGFVILAFAGM